MHDWDSLIAEHGPLVWRTAWRLLRDHQEAADAFQETFLAAVELSRTQDVGHWPGLLRSLATAKALDGLRRRLRRRRWLPVRHLAAADHLPAPRADPAQQAQADELAEQLRLALAQLPPRQAQVFCLRCLEGQSYQEIAQALDLDVNQTGVYLHRARQRLRELLAPQAAAHTPVATPAPPSLEAPA